jgi:hypothetical protein
MLSYIWTAKSQTKFSKKALCFFFKQGTIFAFNNKSGLVKHVQ